MEEKDRVHLTRTSDTSSMIEGESDDERKTCSPVSGKPQNSDVNNPRLCVESRSVEQFHYHHNILVFSLCEDQVSDCVIEQLEYVSQPMLFMSCEAFEPYAVYVAGYSRKHGTSFATTQWTVCAVAMKGERECVRQRGRPTFPRASKTRSSTTGIEKGADPRTGQPMREPSCGNLAELQTSEKLTLTKSYVAPELIVTVQIDLSREEVRRFTECQGKSGESQFLQL